MLDKEIAVSLGAQNVHWRNITISRYDTLWRFIFTVYDGNDVYSIPSGSAIVLIGRKPDDTVFMYSGELVDGKAVVICGDQLSSSSGAVKCELRITEISGIVSSANFILDVEASPSSGFTLSKNDFTALDQLVSRAASASAAIGNTAEVVAGINSEIESLKSLVGSPLKAATISAMTDHDRIYVYTGSETGYVSGNWYYWNGASWTSGGVYNAVAVNTDTSLSVADMAADAKSVGDAIRTDTTLSIADRAADAGVVGEALRSNSVDYAFTIVRGAISSSTGGNTSSTTRLRTQEYLPVTTSWGTVVHIPEGMEATIFVYSTAAQSGYEGLYNGTATWATKAGDNVLTGLKGKYIRVVLRFDNNATIVVADAANVKIYKLTELDPTLSKPGMGADAGALGDVLESAVVFRARLYGTDDLNDIKQSGYYYWVTSASEGDYPNNIPGQITLGGVLVAANPAGNRVIQIIVARDGTVFSRMWITSISAWGEWKTSLTKDRGLSIMRRLVGVPAPDQDSEADEEEPTTGDDLDNVTEIGIYYYSTANLPAHTPSNVGGVLIVFDAIPSASNYKVQVVSDGGSLHYRHRISSGWTDWTEVGNANAAKYFGGYTEDISGKVVFEQGAINSKTGANYSSSYHLYDYRIRTQSDYKTPVNGLRYYLDDEDFKFYAMIYDDSGTFLRAVGWMEAGSSVAVEYGCQVRFVVAKTDDTAITPADAPAILCSTLEEAAAMVADLPELILTDDPDEEKGAGDITKDQAVNLRYRFFGETGVCNVKWQGQSSTRYPKKNYTIKFSSGFDSGKFDGWTKWMDFLKAWKQKNRINTPDESREKRIWRLDGDAIKRDTTTDYSWGNRKKYVAKANWIDPSMARNVVSARLWSQIVATRRNKSGNLANATNGGAVDGFPIHVTINGQSQGLFTLNIPKDENLFDMGDGAYEYVVSAEINAGTSSNAKRANWLVTCNDASLYDDGNSAYAIEYPDVYDDAGLPDPEDPSKQAMFGAVRDSLNAAIAAAMDAHEDWETECADYVDIDSVIDYYIFACCIAAEDAMSKNILYGTYDGQKWFMSAYDLDTTFGSNPYGSRWFDVESDRTRFGAAAEYNRETGNYVQSASRSRHRLFHLVHRYSRAKLVERYRELRATVLSERNVWYEFATFIQNISQARYDENNKLWPTMMGTAIANLHQFMEYYRMHCAYLDEEIEELAETLPQDETEED